MNTMGSIVMFNDKIDVIPPFIYLPNSLHKTINDRKFESPITYTDNLKSTHKNKNISSENRGHSSIDKTHLGINSCNEINMSRKSNDEMVAENSKKVIDTVDLDSIQIVPKNAKALLHGKSAGVCMFVTYTMNNKEKFKRYESHPALSDLDLMKMANAIPPSTMRDVATRYLGLTGSQASGSPLEVLKRWRASAFDPSKQDLAQKLMDAGINI